jgi:hypothetical protein
MRFPWNSHVAKWQLNVLEGHLENLAAQRDTSKQIGMEMSVPMKIEGVAGLSFPAGLTQHAKSIKSYERSCSCPCREACMG